MATTFPDQIRHMGGVPVGVNRLAEIFQAGNIWFVDGTDGATANDGKSPDWAFSVPSEAVSAASKGGVIYVKPKPPDSVALTWYSDSIDIPVTKSNLSIIGAGGQMDDMGGVNIKTSAATDHLIDVQAAGLALENMRLTLNGGTADAGKSIVYAESTYSGGWTEYPNGLYINNCIFTEDQSHSGHSALCSSVALGSANHSKIINNTFYRCLSGVVVAAKVMDPVNIQIMNNIFCGQTALRECDIRVAINAATTVGIIIHGNIFADGLPAHTGGIERFIYFDYLTAGCGIMSNNWFACKSGETEFAEDGTQGVVADNFFACGNFCQGSTNTAPYGLITND